MNKKILLFAVGELVGNLFGKLDYPGGCFAGVDLDRYIDLIGISLVFRKIRFCVKFAVVETFARRLGSHCDNYFPHVVVLCFFQG